MGCDTEINLAVCHKASQWRGACEHTSVCEYLQTKPTSRGVHVFGKNLQAHLPARSEREKKKVGVEQHTHG